MTPRLASLGFISVLRNIQARHRILPKEHLKHTPPRPDATTARPAPGRNRVKIRARKRHLRDQAPRHDTPHVATLRTPPPLDHAADALPAAIVKRLGIPATDLISFTVFKRSYDARKEHRAVLHLHHRPGGEETKRRCSRSSPTTSTSSPPRHPLPLRRQGAGGLRQPPGGHRFRPLRHLCGAGAGQMGFRPSCWSAARRCASAPRTPGACGARTPSTPNPTCSSAKAAPAPSRRQALQPDQDPKHYGRKVLTEFVKAGAPRRSSTSRSRTSAPSGWSAWSRTCAPRSANWAARSASEQRVTDSSSRRPGARREDRHRRRDPRRPRRAGPRPQRPRHLRDAPRQRASSWKPSPFGGLPHRTPQSLIDKARLGPHAGHPLLGAADYKLVHHAANGRRCTASACAPAARWWRPRPSQPGRHQRHEPVFAQRAQRQRRHRGRHHAGRLSRQRPAGRHRAAARAGKPAFELGGGTYEARGNWSGTFCRAGRPPSWAASSPPTNRACAWATCPPPSPTTRSRRSARRSRPSTGRSAASTLHYDAVLTGVETRTSSPCASPAGTTSRALNVRGLTRPARAQAMPEAFCRPAWTGSRWPRPSPLDLLKQA